MNYQVEPSEGDFLLHTAMNIAGYNENNRCSKFHPLRENVRAHYASEINNPLVLKFYNLWLQRGVHHHPPWDTLVDLQKMEFGCEPSDDQNSKQIRDILNRFRDSTDFDKFYVSIFGEYQQVCRETECVLEKADIEGILNKAWEFDAKFEVYVIPRPLDKPFHGDGPEVGNNAVSIIGPGIVDDTPSYTDCRLRHLVSHEVSHTYAKRVIGEILKIAESRGLRESMNKFAVAQRARAYDGETVLEETMIRALQLRYVDPFLDVDNPSVEEMLIREHERNGFEHIFKFDETIRGHKENPHGSLAESIVALMERLIRQHN